MGVLQALTGRDGTLVAAWKGETGDDRLFYSELDGSVWAEQRLVGGNSSAGPSITRFGDDLFLAWKGEGSDERQFLLHVKAGVWGEQQEIAGTASSTGPALVHHNDLVLAAWKGKGDDDAIWYAQYDPTGESWSAQQVVPQAFTSVAPSMAVFQGRAYAAWRAPKNDQSVWWSNFDGTHWAAPQCVPGIASSTGPALAPFLGKLFAAWKGVTGDEALYFSYFDGHSWAPQRMIPDVASSLGPALAEDGGRLYAMWKGASGDQGLYYATFDGLSWSPQKRIPGNSGQDAPENIGLRMQFQQTSLWCWIAVATSVHDYYAGGWTHQCRTMTSIGRRINAPKGEGGWTSTTECCPTTLISQVHPDLLGKLLQPYDLVARHALDGVGIPKACIKSGGVGDALKELGVWAGDRAAMTLDDIEAEIAARRPVVASLTYPTGPGTQASHVVAIAGFLNNQVLIADPEAGEAVITFEEFPEAHIADARVDAWCLTKPPD